MSWRIEEVKITGRAGTYTIPDLWYLVINDEIVAKAFIYAGQLYLVHAEGEGRYEIRLRGLTSYKILKSIQSLQKGDIVDKDKRKYSGNGEQANQGMEGDIKVKIITECGTQVFVSDEDYEYLDQWTWIIAFKEGKPDHVYMKEHSIKMHYVVAFRMGLHFPKYIDHEDRNPLNNQRENLRAATTTQNTQNRSKREGCSSQYKGVHWDKRVQKWKADIQVNGKRKFIGHFDSEIEAAKAWNSYAKRFHGEFAVLNTVEGEAR